MRTNVDCGMFAERSTRSESQWHPGGSKLKEARAHGVAQAVRGSRVLQERARCDGRRRSGQVTDCLLGE